jgi:hypothetical protein
MLTVNLRREPADLVQMQRWQFAIGYDGDVPVSGQFAADCRLDLVQRFFRRRFVKSDVTPWFCELSRTCLTAG